ncbi:uncharacterized protein [Onthophagus taurus]|uniref:uncharacterized protein n=1 Tax=Onthophagus taurus TaxID=166361 RepID=UPI0039BE196C
MSAEKLTRLTLRRTSASNHLQECLALSKDLSDPLTNSIFLERAQDIENSYKDFQTAHNTIIGIIDEADFETHDKVRENAATVYYTIKAVFHQRSPPPTTCRDVPLPEAPKLNKISLPTFDGIYKDWHTFFGLFRTLVHENNSLSSIVKYQYLLSSSKGEPFNLLKGLPVIEANYETAYNTLKGRYNNKRHLGTLYFLEILHVKPLKDESVKNFRALIDTFHENVEGFRTLGFPVEQWDFLLFNLVLPKLTDAIRTTFEAEHTDTNNPTYVQLMTFLEKRAKALESVLLMSGDKTSLMRFKPNMREKAVNLKLEHLSAKPQSSKCILCPEVHPIYRCHVFNGKSAIERLAVAREYNLCRNCLSQNHATHNCSSNRTCRICNQHHHSSLHLKGPGSAAIHVGTSSHKMSSETKDIPHNVILPITPVHIQDNFGILHKVNALIDSGSMSNFISERLSKKLHIPRKYTSCIEIQGLNSMTSICKKGSIDCSVQPIHGQKPSFQFKAIITPSICSNQPSASSIASLHSHLKHLNINSDNNIPTISVDLLLGAELVPQIFTEGPIQGGSHEPIAVNSVFGWILMGKSSLSDPTHNSTCLSTTNASLEKTIQNFWELESVPNIATSSPEDEICERQFVTNYKRTETGRFMVSLPLKKNSTVGKLLPKCRSVLFLLKRDCCTIQRYVSSMSSL